MPCNVNLGAGTGQGYPSGAFPPQGPIEKPPLNEAMATYVNPNLHQEVLPGGFGYGADTSKQLLLNSCL